MLKTSFSLFFALCIGAVSSSHAQSAASAHKKAVVVDTHGDVLHLQIENGLDLGKTQRVVQFDLVRAKKGGLDVQVFAVWSDGKGDMNLANRQIDSLYALIKRNPDKIVLVEDVESLEKAVRENKLAAMIGVEGGHMIENNLENINRLASRGMSYLTLTWNNSTNWASSAADEAGGKIAKVDAGLSDFGKSVVERLNQLGVMVDLSHVGEQTFFDAVAHSSKPVLVSHSSVAYINPVPRNLTDDQIKAIGKNNGVISLILYSGFLDAEYSARRKAFLDKYAEEIDTLAKQVGRSKAIDQVSAKYSKESNNLGPGLSKLVDHIDHIVKLIGVDHVGIGADFDGAESFPQGINSIEDLPKITKALLESGYTSEEVTKMMGGNFIRLLKDNRGK